MKTIVKIERGTDGSYSAYIDSDNVSFGIIGDGDTVAETKKDFENSAQEMKEYYTESGKEFPALEFEYKYDMASFLDFYSKIISLAGLERLTGVNQKQLSHYITGRRNPSVRTVEKIEKALHIFAQEISQVRFV